MKEVYKKEELSYYATIAYNILNKDTDYLKSKNIISTIFNKKWGNRLETIKFRLTIIDNFYSTQMNKRFFGIDDLAYELNKFSDKELRIMCKKYLESETKNNEISELIKSSYGIHKLGKDGGRAGSLISKYLFFLSGFEFPIYDSLVKISYGYIKNKYSDLDIPKLDSKCGDSYFNKIIKLKTESGIETYDKLDNLLWLIGKITNGSLSLIINKSAYQKLLDKLNIQRIDKSDDPDKLIRDKIIDNIDIKGLFKKDELEFIKYSFALADIK